MSLSSREDKREREDGAMRVWPLKKREKRGAKGVRELTREEGNRDLPEFLLSLSIERTRKRAKGELGKEAKRVATSEQESERRGRGTKSVPLETRSPVEIIDSA